MWVLVYLPRDDLVPAELFVLTSSDLHTLLKPVQDAWPKKCQEQHGGPMPGGYGVRRGEVVIMSTPSTTIAAANGWDRPCALATRSSPSATSSDCLARGYDRTGFFEVDTGGQRAWTVQLAKSSEQSVQKPAPPGGPVSGAPSGGSGALPLSGGTPAIALPPGRSGSAPSLPPSGARTQ
jgi:Protein of unknown function (DUF1036)